MLELLPKGSAELLEAVSENLIDHPSDSLNRLRRLNKAGVLGAPNDFDETLELVSRNFSNHDDLRGRFIEVTTTPSGASTPVLATPRYIEANHLGKSKLTNLLPTLAKGLESIVMLDSVQLAYIVPLQFLIKGSRKARGGYSVYISRIREIGNTYLYVGLTSRKPVTRFVEHFKKAKSGSSLLHAAKLRENLNQGIDTTIDLEVVASGLSEDEANALEEKLVDLHSLAGKHEFGLNMIPGGKAGARFLSSLVRERDSNFSRPERRMEFLENNLTAVPAKNRDGSAVAAAWRDARYAAAVICGPANRLSVSQIRAIRTLNAEG